MKPSPYAILNQGVAAWAFQEHAERLAEALWLEITTEPAEFNYLLAWDLETPPTGRLFIPWKAIQLASDKRLQASMFARDRVPTPETILVDTPDELRQILEQRPGIQWVLKYPTGCGGSGHRIIGPNSVIREDWPRPFVMQEFVRMANPEVYRLYCVDRALFGWNARRFPVGTSASPWVAHARGARYVHLNEPPLLAREAARAALEATGLWNSFGAVDLLVQGEEWLVLEVGTDGINNHVDREVDHQELIRELNSRLAEAFWRDINPKPWGEHGWRPKPKLVAHV